MSFIQNDIPHFKLAFEHGNVSKAKAYLRQVDDDPQESCRQCKFQKYCLPCMAVNWKMHGKLYMGDTGGPIRPANREESV